MPSMKCYECKTIKRCSMCTERGEGDRLAMVYYCRACRTAIDRLAALAVQDEEAGA
jgi:hypothetical protein